MISSRYNGGILAPSCNEPNMSRIVGIAANACNYRNMYGRGFAEFSAIVNCGAVRSVRIP
jgi:hypothetical protein